MAVYDWREFENVDLAGRFPRRGDIVGVEQWQRLIAAIRDLVDRAETPEGFDDLSREFDQFLVAVAALDGPNRVPRVFVSHQRDDWEKGERVAWHATEVGFEYWLDIHDPVLAFANRSIFPRPIKAVLIAGIIEMGLLNSTHVVAVQTPKSQRSHWVPYEFGRAKYRRLVSGRAASWFESPLGPDPDGDYLSLAFCALSEPSLNAWFGNQPGARRSGRNTLWPKPHPPKALPN